VAEALASSYSTTYGDHNAMLHLFSAGVPQRAYGVGHYRRRSPDTSTLINQLLQEYQREEIAMPYTMQDFRRDYAKEHFKDLTPEEQQDVIKDLTPEQRLKDLPPEQVLKALTPEQVLKALTPEQVLKALTPEQRERLRVQLTTERTSSQTKKRRRK
jgi:flagellar motor switch protein FliG